MSPKIIPFLLFSCLAILPRLYAQEQPTLSEAEFIQIVKKFHPVAKQTQNDVKMAEAEILKARGAFDPTLGMSSNQKQLVGKQYYNYSNATLSIPTWYGIEFNAGLEQNSGTQADPERTLGSSSYAGVSFSVLKNVIIDKRRGALAQAKIVATLSQQERNATLNDLLYDALTQYWQWVQSYQEYELAKSMLDINIARLDFVRNMVVIGERPGIDTVEAYTQLQFVQNLMSEALMNLQTSQIQLSTFTWKDNNEFYTLPTNLQPAKFNSISEIDTISSIESLVTRAMLEHPELKIYDNKLDFLDIEKKVKFQELLPNVKLKYNQLGKSYELNNTVFQPLFENNYQYGVSFAMPLRLSEARADYKQVKLKINTTQLQQDFKQRSIENKIREQYVKFFQIKQQISLQSEMLANQKMLVKGEEIRFQNGESSLFLINSREQKQIETNQKLLATTFKLYKQWAGLRWASGLLYLE
jgi:outer membrane protein TolC